MASSLKDALKLVISAISGENQSQSSQDSPPPSPHSKPGSTILLISGEALKKKIESDIDKGVEEEIDKTSDALKTIKL